jgi:hypothetical protein
MLHREYVSVSVESFGRLGRRRTHCCAASPMRRRRRLPGAFIESALQEMSVTLCKADARVLRSQFSRVYQASGLAYLRGLPVPVA